MILVSAGFDAHRDDPLAGLSLEEADFEGGGSDKFIDTTFAWGTVDAIKDRIQQHFDAGASHVCLQPVNPNGQFGDLHWEGLEALIS